MQVVRSRQKKYSLVTSRRLFHSLEIPLLPLILLVLIISMLLLPWTFVLQAMLFLFCCTESIHAQSLNAKSEKGSIEDGVERHEVP